MDLSFERCEDATTYSDPSYGSVTFLTRGEQVIVTIETLRTKMVPVEATEAHYADYFSLFNDPVVVERYLEGKPLSMESLQKRIDTVWAKRWTEEKDPFSAFKVLDKKTGAFIGHGVLGHGDRPGQAEGAGLLKRAHWGYGYGTELANVFLKVYVPALIQEGYTVEGKPLDQITATVRLDNPASKRIMEKLGLKMVEETELYGATRYRFALDILDVA